MGTRTLKNVSNELVAAIEEGDMIAFGLLFDPRTIDLNARNDAGTTPLIAAVKADDTITFGMMIFCKGLDKNATDKDGKTALYHAIKEKRDIMKAFLM